MSFRSVTDELIQQVGDRREFTAMRVEPNTDVRALRRISLLVLRAKDDWGPCCRELDEIVSVIERMKRNIAVSSPLVGADLRRMTALVGGLSCAAVDHDRLHRVVFNELRDLVGQITP